MSDLAEEGAKVIASEGEYVEPPRRPGKKRGRKPRVEEPPFMYQPNSASIKTCVIFSSILMRVLCRVAKWEPTTKEEEQQIGEALDPVLQKRLPALAGWGEEIALAMVLVGVIAPRVLNPSEAKFIEEDEVTYERTEKPPDEEKKIITTEDEIPSAVNEAVGSEVW